MWTKRFWLDAVERAVKTAAQASVGVFSALSAAQAAGAAFDWTAWAIGLGVTVGLSFGTSILSSLAGNRESASLVDGGTSR